MKKNLVDVILSMVGPLNEKLFPFSLIIPAVIAVALISGIILVFVKPGDMKRSRRFTVILGLVYIFAGASILAGIDKMGLAAFEGAFSMWVIAFILFYSLRSKSFFFSLPAELDLKIISLYLIIHGLVLYPVVELLAGFRWPTMVLIGAECPTTILLIGLLIGSIKRVNTVLMTILCLFAAIWGGYVALNGFLPDGFYSLAGILGLIMVLKYKMLTKSSQRIP